MFAYWLIYGIIAVFKSQMITLDNILWFIYQMFSIFFTFKLNCIKLFWLQNIFPVSLGEVLVFLATVFTSFPHIQGNFPLYGISSPTFSQGGIPSSLLSLQQIMLNPFFLNKKINSYLLYFLRRFLRPWKSAVICSQRAMLPIQSGVTASADSNGSLAHFVLIWTSWIGVIARCW